MTAGCALDLCSNLGFFQGKMEQRLLGTAVSGRDVGLGLEELPIIYAAEWWGHRCLLEAF